MNISDIVSILQTKETIINDNKSIISELCIDSRQVQQPKETLFFALKTDKNDGHRFIGALVTAGARNFIVTEPLSNFQQYTHCNFIRVRNAVTALQNIAQTHRQQFDYKVIGITGSNGKTIVKEWLSIILTDEFNIVKSPDSYNSQLGVPLSVWQMSKENNLGIFEAGISKPGEMCRLADIIRPNLGILTNIGMAHAQFFDNDQQKINEKLQLFKNCDTLIFHDDNDLIYNTLQENEYTHLRKISWGSARAVYPIENRQVENDHTLLTINGFQYSIPFLDAASLENATHVIITLLTLGIAPEVINNRLSRLSRISMRMEIQEGIHHSVLINDTYSLDINSLRIALDFLDTQTQLEHKTLIISDFEQVGDLQQSHYKELNTLIQTHHISKLIAVGKNLYQNQRLFHCESAFFYKDSETLLMQLLYIEFSYEAILIKGARSFHFEEVVSRLMDKTHLTILNVSLPALVHNLNYYRSFLKPTTKMVAMVKALSYGLGDAELVNELVHQNIDYLAVAYTDEGVRLRKRHIQTPIIVLGAEAHSFEVMVQNNLEPEVFNFFYLKKLEEVLRKNPQIKSFKIHLKMDTGMHRLGFDKQDLPELIYIIQHNPQLKIASVFSHLASAEDPNDDDFTRSQITLFKEMADQICNAFDYPILQHILNSAGITRFSEAQFDMVRLGIGLYGFSEVAEIQPYLHNVATLKTIITQVKRIPKGESIGYNRSFRVEHDMQVAIIPIGYADGYPRELSNGKGKVIIQGHKVPVIGKICMDMCMLDVTGLIVHEGDEVIVYGEGNTIAEVAESIGRISYELLTGISKRVPRVYVKE